MKPQTTWQAISAVLALIVLLLAVALTSTRSHLKRTIVAMQMTEATLAELKENVQKAVAAEDQKSDQQARLASIIGVYRSNVLGNNQVDLRSDGTAYWFYEGVQSAGKVRWTMEGNIITVGTVKFTQEQADLIDTRGRRWVHVR